MELGLLGTRMQLTSPGNTWDRHSGWTGCLFTLLFFFHFLLPPPLPTQPLHLRTTPHPPPHPAPLCQSAWAVLTKYQGLNSLNVSNFYPTVMETEKSEVQLPVSSVSGESPLPDLQTLASQCVLMCSFLGVCVRRERSLFLLYKVTNPIGLRPHP